MPVDYTPPMDVQTAPPGYSQPAPAVAYAGNADAQRYMADQAGQGYGQADYGMVPPVQVSQAQYAPSQYDQPAAQPATYPAAANPFPRAVYQPVNPAAAQPAMMQGQPQAAYVPAQYFPSQPQQNYPQTYPQQGYVAPAQTYAAPVYQQAPTYQPAPVYQQQAPAYQQPSYAQPTYRAPTQPAITYPSESYSRQGFGTQPYGNADYAIAPVQGYAPPPRPTYSAPAYTPPIQSYAAPTYYASPVYSQPAPPPTYVPVRKYVKPVRTKWRPKKLFRAKPRSRYVAVRPAAPVQTYAYPAQPVQTYAPTPTYAPPAPVYQPQPAYAPQPAPAIPYAVPAPNTYGSADPEMDRINAEIASLSADNAPRAEVGVGFRYRDGEVGLGRLNELSGRFAASTGLGPGRVELSVSPVYVDAGKPSGQGLARFGTNPLPQAQAVAGGFAAVLPAAPGQHDSGVAVKLAYDTGNLQFDAGTTPIGFGKTEIQGGARWSPHLSQNVTARVYAERRPVTDSVVSYAGTVDPATGVRWGEVMKTGGGGGISYDRGAGAGFYVDGNYYFYDGRNVRQNWNAEVNVGGYLTAWRRDTSTITAGVNFNYQHYDNSQNFFSYGNGGYFSPQQYFSISFPLRYRTISGPLSLDATLTPGFQTYRQSSAAVFPTSDPLQAQLLRYQAGNPAVLARYGSLSKSGFGVAFQGVGWYRVAPSTAIGGELRLNTFGGYNEAQALLRLRQSLGGGALQ